MDVGRRQVFDLVHHRSKKRIKDLGEVFTPEEYVYKMLDLLDQSIWSDENIVFFEPTCGHGNFVIAVVTKRLDAFLKKANRQGQDNPHLYAIANTLNNLWATDIDSQNIDYCRKRVWNKILSFFIEHEKVKTSLLDLNKNKNFWAHILCCIKWQIHENEMLSSLEHDPKVAKIKAEQTVISKKWLRKNDHNPIDFEMPWTEYFTTLRRNGTTPVEFSRSLKFVDSLKYGTRKGSFKDFIFAHPKEIPCDKRAA